MIDATFLAKLKELALENTDIRDIIVGDAEHIPGTRYILDIPAGRTSQDITEKVLASLPHPQHRSGTVTLTSLDSLSAYVLRMQEPDSVLFADQAGRSITCVFDHHEAVNKHEFKAEPKLSPDGDTMSGIVTVDVAINPDAKPRWGRFRAVYPFPRSEAWAAWEGGNKQPKMQAALAEWIEDHIEDVLDIQNVDEIQSEKAKELISQLSLKVAGRATLLTAARGMQINVTEEVASAVNTTSGEIQVSYIQAHAGKDPQIQIPTAFVIALPVFEGGDRFELLVRLRYRKDGSALKWWYDVYNMKRAIDLAFTSSCKGVSATTGLPLFYADLKQTVT